MSLRKVAWLGRGHLESRLKGFQRNDEDIIFFFVFKKILDETTDAVSQDHRSGKSCVL